MPPSLLLLVSIAALVSLVPLCVLAATGSWSRAWQALREYLLVIGLLAIPGVVATLITLVDLLIG